MVRPIQSHHGPEPFHQTSKEKLEILELKWEINLLEILITVSNKNGNIKHQLESIKKGLRSSTSEQLVPEMNQLINQIDIEIKFPPFDLTSGGNEHKAMTQYVLSVEQYLKVAVQQNQLSSEKEEMLLKQTSDLITNIPGAFPLEESKRELDKIISAANQLLPPQYKIPTIGNK